MLGAYREQEFKEEPILVRDWAELNRQYAAEWPNITRKGEPPADADEWKNKPGKRDLFSAEPGTP